MAGWDLGCAEDRLTGAFETWCRLLENAQSNDPVPFGGPLRAALSGLQQAYALPDVLFGPAEEPTQELTRSIGRQRLEQDPFGIDIDGQQVHRNWGRNPAGACSPIASLSVVGARLALRLELGVVFTFARVSSD